MSSSHALYNQLFAFLRTVHPEPHVTRIRNWVTIMVGMILAQSVQLSQIAHHIPSDAQAAGRLAQIRRWLSNRFVKPIEFYRPLIRQTLAAWQGRAGFIILDGTLVNHGKLQILRLSLAHVCRALPLTWLVIRGTGLVTVEQTQALLDEALGLLRGLRRVTLLADRGFRDTDWAEQCRTLGWHYLIRVANNTSVRLTDGRWLRIERLGVKPAQRRYFHQVALTKDKAFVCNLMVTWTVATPTQPAELCAVITNLRPCRDRLEDYLKRMHIEASFRDDKSGSCELAHTKLRDPERLNHLLLALAVVTLWVHELGQQVCQRKQRKEIDPAVQRQLSIFQLGWRKLRRTISLGCLPPITLVIRPMRLAPVVVVPKHRKC